MVLLDVNALIALADPDHEHHQRVRTWFKAIARQGWATCPLTENGFVRVLSNPIYPNAPGSPEVVRSLLVRLCLYPGHQFWPDSVSLRELGKIPNLNDVKSKQLTDLYLLALAVERKGQLATLDERVQANRIPDGGKAYWIIPESV